MRLSRAMKAIKRRKGKTLGNHAFCIVLDMLNITFVLNSQKPPEYQVSGKNTLNKWAINIAQDTLVPSGHSHMDDVTLSGVEVSSSLKSLYLYLNNKIHVVSVI